MAIDDDDSAIKTGSEKATDQAKKKIKQQNQRLHPLKYNILNNPFFKYSDEKNTIENVKRLVNLDIMLTTVSTVLMVLLVTLIIRLPSVPAGTQAPTPTVLPDTGGTATPTPTNQITGPGGQVINDNRGNSDGEFDNGGEEQENTKLYANTSFGFTIRYPESWKVTETQNNGKTITRIEDEDNDFDTYMEFTNVKPDLTQYEGTGTPNKRDVFTSDSIYRAEGFVKFGRATFASIPIEPGEFYINYAGDVENTILPMLATFTY
ncbi:MAG: hypothetical protein TR69_WS6001000269 [candidate division WS6 bacterium OLB20]|uniref:Uncharacterized protein n=1 Tax=candidate division WS6 bacterium OLB20 TaxID=1617426 RepID=A0A136M0H1_9BACT|nr:MAG: hypothetical protein TR69_WS6001000269 [candidate division WS6 bacterium OLB20]